MQTRWQNQENTGYPAMEGNQGKYYAISKSTIIIFLSLVCLNYSTVSFNTTERDWIMLYYSKCIVVVNCCCISL